MSVKRNITNEYSDYHFHFYLGNLPDKTLGYHWECYSSYTHTQKIYNVSKPTSKTKKNLKLLIFSLLHGKVQRYHMQLVSKIISAYSIYLLKKKNGLKFPEYRGNSEQKYNLQTVKQLIQFSYLLLQQEVFLVFSSLNVATCSLCHLFLHLTKTDIIKKNVLRWFLLIICKDHSLTRSTNLISRNHLILCFCLRRRGRANAY